MLLNEILCTAFMNVAVSCARSSNCTKANFGAVVVPTFYLTNPAFQLPLETSIQTYIEGMGYNKSLLTSATCSCIREDIPSGTRVERCYAIHAEQSAMLDAIDNIGLPLEGYSIVLARTEVETGVEVERGVPGFYCTLCSRMAKFTALDGIVLRIPGGFTYLTADEMFKSSYDYAFERKEVKFARPSEEVH